MLLNISLSTKFNPYRYIWYKLKKDMLVLSEELYKGDIIGILYRKGEYYLVRKTNVDAEILIPHHEYKAIERISNIVDYTTEKKLDKQQTKEMYARYNELFSKETDRH